MKIKQKTSNYEEIDKRIKKREHISYLRAAPLFYLGGEKERLKKRKMEL